VVLVWLPTLTVTDEVNQKNASAFNLRKKPEFLGKRTPTFRSQLLRMNGVQKRVKKSKSEKKIQKQSKIQKNYTQEKRKIELYIDKEFSPIEPNESRIPLTSIHALLNHNYIDNSNQASTYYNLSTAATPNLTDSSSMKTFNQFNFRKLCPCILKEF